MIIERDLPVEMDDGVVLRVDVYRPDTKAKVPIVMAGGPYGKGVKYQEHYKPLWDFAGEDAPRYPGGIAAPLADMGDGGPRDMGGLGLRLRTLRFARRGPLTRLSRYFLPARDQGISPSPSNGRGNRSGRTARSD